MKARLTLILLLFSTAVFAQNHNHTFNRKIIFPNVPGYLTLKCDLHIHTVFSDGAVWPDIRVMEAEKDGLDVISLTEHLEYQPHKADIPHPNRNRSYELAQKLVANKPLMLVHGAEITRSMPPGHNNAIFIKDANKLLKDDALEVFREARKQGAFTFWNHPNWLSQRADGVTRLEKLHEQLIDEKLLNGIEVVNGKMYSDEAIAIALEHNLTMIGTSDVHGLIDYEYDIPHGDHRPITMVFAKDRTEDALKEALFAGRTAVWYKNTLIGKEENIAALVMASLKAVPRAYPKDRQVVTVSLQNVSDAAMILKNTSEFNFHGDSDVVTVPAQGKLDIQVKTLKQLDAFDLSFEVMNTVIAPQKHLHIMLSVKPGE